VIVGTAMPELSVIVMAYDEIANLESVVTEIHGELVRLGRSHELVIVDDGSTDGTGALADRLAGRLPDVRSVHHPVNLGLGGVYRTGFREARGDVVTFFPADGQFPAAIIGQFVPRMDGADFVLGYLPDRRSSALARFLSWGERVLYRILFGGFPRFQGIMMFRRLLLDRVELRSEGRGWGVVMELILRCRALGCRMLSVPTAMRPRLSGESKVNNGRTILANLRQAFALYHVMREPGSQVGEARS
jgi:glycosyltransferase involved in cell wall biosynthesis